MTYRRLAVALAASLLAACAGRRVAAPPPPQPLLDPPRLTVQGLTPHGLDAFGVTLEVTGVMENPNPVPMPLEGFDYAVELEGRAVDTGRVDFRTVLPPGGSSAFAVPALLHWLRIPDLAARLGPQRSLALRVTGTARVRGARALPWETEATVVIPPRLPQVSFEGSRVRESSVFQTTLELSLRVRNPNDFPLPTGNLLFDLSVSGSVVANATSQALEEVPPQGEVLVLIPVKFSPLGTVTAALSGAAHLKANVGLKGRAGWGGLEVRVDQKVGL
jgi:LEA14-like dessication related protein